MVELVWLIPLLPLAGFGLLLLVGRRIGEPGAGWLATLTVAGSFVATCIVFAGLLSKDADARHYVLRLYTWVPAGGFHVDLGFLADPLSITMCLFITGVGALIHVYAIGYMHGDRDFAKFFMYLNLFVFSMLMLVLGENLLVTFLGWEGVGACSYFLIAFWFSEEANASAGKKAFVTNRIGDWGFMVAMFLAFSAAGTLSYSGLLPQATTLAPITVTAIIALLFVGAVGKSAQIPLFIWLPDAMAGPTPVSALIHAATMVTAGVYLMCRMSPFLAAGYDWVPWLIAIIGVATAFVAALAAIVQNDIKKVLAYSTISQLGYMFLAVGSGAYSAAIFHMVTNAFFKALLFLGAGSVIHGMHEEQDMRRMGGLRKFMPITAATFIVAWLAIAGVFPFAGFWSKDEILLNAYDKSPALWAVGWITALLTAFYMSRQVFMVFFGKPRFAEVDQHAVPSEGEEAAALSEPETADAPQSDEAGHHAPTPHESPWIMTIPLIVLAALSFLGGGINLPFAHGAEFLDQWLEPVFGAQQRVVEVAAGLKWGLALVSLAAALIGVLIAYAVYLRRRVPAERVEVAPLNAAVYYDGAISAFVDGPGEAAFNGAAAFDRGVVDGAVGGVAWIVRTGAKRLRVVQTGYVRSYALGLAAGAVLLLGFFIVRVGV